ncbi:MAG: GTPase Era [Bacilli bacterium]|nr:GTPase Era [Bacilli bacterium]
MKSGFVSILGRPNVGKSTLLNAILNHKISIVTDKSQTTRNTIRGIYNSDHSQIIFIDTPGIHKPYAKLSQEMNNMAYSSAHNADINILVVDSGEQFGDGDEYILSHLDISNTPLIIVFNKIDLTRIDKITKLKEIYSNKFPKAVLIETVAKEKFNVDQLISSIEALLPECERYYSDDLLSDKDEIFQIKEIIREKTLKILKQEVPHSIAIYIDNIEWEKNPMLIQATIFVEKESQKGIVIGANGKRIKLIGQKSRESIEALLHKHVYLELLVKVEPDWRDNPELLEKFGYKYKNN